MTNSIRNLLKEQGWRQGVIVEADASQHPNALGYLVLTQTCDCINPDFDKEPHLELLPLVVISGDPIHSYKDGRNPRVLHFPLNGMGKSIWVEAKAAEIFVTERKTQELRVILHDFCVDSPILNDLILWRAARYLRVGFPDSFELAFEPFASKFRKMVERHHKLIDTILVSLVPWAEIADDECYEIKIHFLVTPVIAANEGIMTQLGELTKKVEKLFATSTKFVTPRCTVTALTEMNLWERRKYLDFTRFDYFSFGKEEETDAENFQI